MLLHFYEKESSSPVCGSSVPYDHQAVSDPQYFLALTAPFATPLCRTGIESSPCFLCFQHILTKSIWDGAQNGYAYRGDAEKVKSSLLRYIHATRTARMSDHNPSELHHEILPLLAKDYIDTQPEVSSHAYLATPQSLEITGEQVQELREMYEKLGKILGVNHGQ